MTAAATGLDVEATLRAEVYAFLSRSLQYPTAAIDRRLLSHAVFADDTLDECRRAVLASGADPVPSLQAAHRGLFPPVESQDAPSYETAYADHDVFRQGEIMADVAGFYQAHGLQLGGVRRDRPDAIGPQLEFMSFLARKEAHARATGATAAAEICLESQCAFLRDHLGAWGPEYGRRLAAVSDHDFYRNLGRFLTVWFEADMAHLAVAPRDVGAILGPTGATSMAIPGLGWADDGPGCGDPS
jgi:TorA maturation chaperone TorD